MYTITVKSSDVHETWYEKQCLDITRTLEELMKRCVLGSGFDIIMTYVAEENKYETGSINQFVLRDDVTREILR